MYEVKTYQGFEIEKSMKLLPGTKKALKILAKKNVVKVVRDDGPGGYEAMKQLAIIASDIGLDIFPKVSFEKILNLDLPHEIVIVLDPPSVEV